MCALIAGAQGSKSIFTDGMQVDHISENTNGHGARVKGVTSPTSYPVIAGDVGEIIEASWVSGNILNSAAAVCNITLTPGVWRLSGNAKYQTGGAAATSMQMSITTIAASHSPIVQGKDFIMSAVSSVGVGQCAITGFIVNITASIIYYLNVDASVSATSNYCAAYLLAQRIA